MQLPVKLQKAVEITHLKANKQHANYDLRYLEVSKEEKRYH